MKIYNLKDSLIYEGNSMKDAAQAIVADYESYADQIIKIYQNWEILSTLIPEQAVSWLYVNKKIVITTENLQIVLAAFKENRAVPEIQLSNESDRK